MKGRKNYEKKNFIKNSEKNIYFSKQIELFFQIYFVQKSIIINKLSKCYLFYYNKVTANKTKNRKILKQT